MKVYIPDFPVFDGTEDPLQRVLAQLQLTFIPESTFVMVEDRDWLVVLQCMQDHGLFKSNPQRPPLKEFAAWVETNNIPQLLAHCSVYQMSLASRALRGERYPWRETSWEPNVLRRWRRLYEDLDRLLKEAQEHFV